MSAPYRILVFLSAERLEALSKELRAVSEDLFAGLRALSVPVAEEQKDRLLSLYPTAKCDSATTRTVELLPRSAKDRLFSLIVASGRTDVLEDFLSDHP
ncbi:MAG: hypothetical protein M0Z66_08500 [Thermaerobacter sp.]|nr:hypothetical protein [Thermaerobacter sp.]